jgi:hypothetical protein
MALRHRAEEVLLKFSSQVSHVPQGVVPPAQLFIMPSTRRPAVSADVFIRSCPAAGPVMSMGLSRVMRRAYFECGTTDHLPLRFLAISITDPPWAAISTSHMVLEILSALPLRASATLFRPGNNSSVLVYSWFTARSPRRDPSMGK